MMTTSQRKRRAKAGPQRSSPPGARKAKLLKLRPSRKKPATAKYYDVWLCADCTMAEANGDYSGFDSDERVQEVQDGLTRLTKEGGHLSANWDSETGEGIMDFSRAPCEGCRSPLHGSRDRWALWYR